jgi:hypothetical protein
MRQLIRSELVLALRPFARGYGFVVFEGPLSPIDWGTKEVRGGNRNTRSLASAQDLMDRIRPDVLVLEDLDDGHARRSSRIRRLHSLLVNYAEGQSLEIRRYSKASVNTAFKSVGATSRYEIAQAIAARVAAFENKLPASRKSWESEDPRMILFDAAALALTHYWISIAQS